MSEQPKGPPPDWWNGSMLDPEVRDSAVNNRWGWFLIGAVGVFLAIVIPGLIVLSLLLL